MMWQSLVGVGTGLFNHPCSLPLYPTAGGRLPESVEGIEGATNKDRRHLKI
jgi:hypothetical protein